MNDHPSRWIQSGLTCSDVARRTSDYLEGRLSVFTKVRVGLHLAVCVDCRTYAKQLAVVCETLEGLPKLYPSPISRLRLRRQFAAYHCQSASGNYR